MASIELGDGTLTIHIHGWDKLLALRSTLTLPLSEIRDVTARPGDAQYDHMRGLRVGGGYWPGLFAAGYFWVTGGIATEKQAALEKLEAIRKDLAVGADPEACYANAIARIEEAEAAVKKGLHLASVPEARRYLAFFDVHDPTKTIGIDVEHGRLRRVVIELDTESPEAARARLLAALGKPAA
jgi:hypothetical protein